MGDRANVLIRDRGDDVFLYTHWQGTELPGIVQYALRKRERWDDAPYLARIVFCAMVAGDEKGTTGYGISGRVGDGDNRVLALDVGRQLVSIVSVVQDGFYKQRGKSYSFEEFTTLDLESDNLPEW